MNRKQAAIIRRNADGTHTLVTVGSGAVDAIDGLRLRVLDLNAKLTAEDHAAHVYYDVCGKRTAQTLGLVR